MGERGDRERGGKVEEMEESLWLGWNICEKYKRIIISLRKKHGFYVYVLMLLNVWHRLGIG